MFQWKQYSSTCSNKLYPLYIIGLLLIVLLSGNQPIEASTENITRISSADLASLAATANETIPELVTAIQTLDTTTQAANNTFSKFWELILLLSMMILAVIPKRDWDLNYIINIAASLIIMFISLGWMSDATSASDFTVYLVLFSFGLFILARAAVVLYQKANA